MEEGSSLCLLLIRENTLSPLTEIPFMSQAGTRSQGHLYSKIFSPSGGGAQGEKEARNGCWLAFNSVGYNIHENTNTG